MKKDFLPRWPSRSFEQRPGIASPAVIVDKAQSELAQSLHTLEVTDDATRWHEAQEIITRASHTLASHIMPSSVSEVFLPNEAEDSRDIGFEKPTFNNMILLAKTVDATQDPAIRRTLEYVIINELPYYGEVVADAYVSALISGEPIMTEYKRLSAQEDDRLDPEIREPGPRPANYPS